MPQRVRWGIIGSTNWAYHTFTPAIIEARNAELVAVLGTSQDKVDAFINKHQTNETVSIKGYTQPDEFLADENVDVVWIASGNKYHASHAIAAMKSGKHVLVEKPMTTNSDDAQCIMQTAKDNERLVSVGYHNRHSPGLQNWQQRWSSGEFGSPIMARFQMYAHIPVSNQTQLEHRDHGGFALSYIGTHLLDLARWFMGDLDLVSSRLSNIGYGFNADDHCMLILEAQNGASVIVDAAVCVNCPTSRFELYGSKGFVVIEDGFFGGGKAIVQMNGEKEQESLELPHSKPYTLQVEAFSRSVLSNSVPLCVTENDGKENVGIIDQVLDKSSLFNSNAK